MSFISKIFGKASSESVDSVFEGTNKILDGLITNKEEKAKVFITLTKAQTELNKLNAAHRTIFVAGWRPFIGWICGLSLLYNYIIKDITNYFIKVNYPDFDPLPSLQMEHLMTILLGMLGLAGYRSVEKIMNKTK